LKRPPKPNKIIDRERNSSSPILRPIHVKKLGYTGNKNLKKIRFEYLER